MTEQNKGQIVIYKDKSGEAKIDVRVEKETVWLRQKQIAQLFDTKRPAITKHLNNIFNSKELSENSVCSILEHTAEDGKIYTTKFYNLDAIISVGYRVNSKRATQFRIWATNTLRNHLVHGHTLNQKLLTEQKEKFSSLQESIKFIEKKADNYLNSISHIAYSIS